MDAAARRPVPAPAARAGQSSPEGRPDGGRLAELDLGEDVGLADAGSFNGVVGAVGSDRVDGPVRGGDAVVVADERPGGEEPQVGFQDRVLIRRDCQLAPSLVQVA